MTGAFSGTLARSSQCASILLKDHMQSVTPYTLRCYDSYRNTGEMQFEQQFIIVKNIFFCLFFPVLKDEIEIKILLVAKQDDKHRRKYSPSYLYKQKWLHCQKNEDLICQLLSHSSSIILGFVLVCVCLSVWVVS